MISTFVIGVKKKFCFASCHHDDPLRDNTVANSIYYLKFPQKKMVASRLEDDGPSFFSLTKGSNK